MSSHYKVSFSQLVEDALFFTSNQLANMINKTKAFLKQRIVEDLRLYRQLNQYQGTPATSFWERQFSSAQPLTLQAAGKNIKENLSVNKGEYTGKDFVDKLTRKQTFVFGKIMDIATKQGYEISALPSPSDDMIIDVYMPDFRERIQRNKEKVFVKRR